MIKRGGCLLVVVLFFVVNSMAQDVTIIKERLLVDKKQNSLSKPGSKNGNMKIKLVSKNKKRKARKKKIIITKKYKKGKKTYTKRKITSKKKNAKAKKYSKKKIHKKRKKYAKKKSSKKKKNMKETISQMKTCAVYNPPGRKHASVVVEATSDKNRKISKRKRCRTYRKVKKNGKSVLVIEVEESQI